MRLNLGYQAFIAIIAGIVIGLFFGSYCSILKPIGDSFFILLQMVVLPYIPFLLMQGLGSLNTTMAKKLVKKGWGFLFILWGSTLSVIYLLIYLIPNPETAFIENRETGGIFQSLTDAIPESFVSNLSNILIPAIAIFGLLAGVAIMHLKKKQPLLHVLERLNAMIEKILDWIAYIAPVAIFAHVAVAAGTVHFENLAKVEFYALSYIAGALFLTFWVFPVIATSLTNFSYQDVMREYHFVCWIPFATALPSLAFPFMYRALKRLSKRYAIEGPAFNNTGQTVLPLTFTFAQVGNLFILLFIFFLSFYTRHPLQEFQKLSLPLLTFPLSFGTVYSSISATSFLIDTMHFPINSFSLFELTSTLTTNFQVLVSVSSILILTILILSSYYGMLRVKWHYLITHLSLAMGCFTLLVIFVKSQIHLQDNFTDLYRNLKMPTNLSKQLKVTIHSESHPTDARGTDPLSTILSEGVLRVGYSVVDIPFCYLNNAQELVGYDIAFAHQLALDLGCSLELVPLDYNNLSNELNHNTYDIIMSGIVMDEERLRYMDFVQPYLEQSNVLIVKLDQKSKFNNLKKLQEDQQLTIGAIGAYEDLVKRKFPLATLVPMQTTTPFLEGKADLLMWTYLSSFIWCLDHPEYTILDFDFQLGKKYLSYPVKIHAIDWLNFVQNWLNLKKQSGFTHEQYLYWIKGESITPLEPRWSVIRNVLHWVD